jgi:hypothetical protein
VEKEFMYSRSIQLNTPSIHKDHQKLKFITNPAKAKNTNTKLEKIR